MSNRSFPLEVNNFQAIQEWPKLGMVVGDLQRSGIKRSLQIAWGSPAVPANLLALISLEVGGNPKDANKYEASIEFQTIHHNKSGEFLDKPARGFTLYRIKR